MLAVRPVMPRAGAELHSPWGSTVALIHSSGPLVWTVGEERPKPAIATEIPAGNEPPGVGSATAWTAGPLRSSGFASAITATSSGLGFPCTERPGGRG